FRAKAIDTPGITQGRGTETGRRITTGQANRPCPVVFASGAGTALIRFAVVADALGEDFLQAVDLTPTGHPAAVGTIGQGGVHGLERALEHAALDGAASDDPRGGIGGELLGAGARRAVIQNPIPHIRPGCDQLALGIEAAVHGRGWAVFADAAVGV